MGNIHILNRNKEFQSVAPFPNVDNVADGPNGKGQQPSAKRKKSMNKTAPSPDDVVFTNSGKFPIINSITNAARVSSFQTEDIVSDIMSSSTTDNNTDQFDFQQTESQLRRKGMADCEFECSQITSNLFVGGYHVAGNRELLRSLNITRVINLSAAVVENHFINEPGMTYYSVNMVDGRQDDIFWFLCDVVQFILRGQLQGEKTLLHCEKGVSRSCSFAIAYHMWSTGEKWKAAFEYVKARRAVCAPNTAFTCNLIEIGEILANEVVTRNLLFRCAFHLPHDPLTAVLKLCRNPETRKIIQPATSLLDPRGVFVVRATSHNHNQQHVFVWKGSLASSTTLERAKSLASNLFGIVTNTEVVCEEVQGQESALFLSLVLADGEFGASTTNNSTSPTHLKAPVPYDDLYDNKPSLEAALVFQREHDQLRISRDRPVPIVRESSIKGFESYPEMERFRKENSSSNMDTGPEHSGKLSKVPSLRMPTAVENSTAVSRRSSHTRTAVPGLDRLPSGSSMLRDGGDAQGSDSPSSSTNVSQPALVASLNSSESRKGNIFLSLDMGKVGTIQDDCSADDSSTAIDRHGGNGDLFVPPVLHSRGASMKLPKVDEDCLASPTESARNTDRGGGGLLDTINSGRSQDSSESSAPSSARRDLILKIADMVSGESISSGMHAKHNVPSLALQSMDTGTPKTVPQLSLSIGADKEKCVVGAQREGSSATALPKLVLAQPPVLSVAGRLSQALGDSPPSDGSKRRRGGDKDDEVQEASVAESSMSGAAAKVTKSPSKSRLLLNLVSGGDRPQSASTEHSLFRSGSKRIVPLPMDVVEPVQRQLGSPPSSAAGRRGDEVVSDSSPPLLRRDSASRPSLALSSVQQQALLVTPQKEKPREGGTLLSLPAAALLRSPSVDRHPDHVGLSRGPTPAEDLVMGRSGTREQLGADHAMSPVQNNNRSSNRIGTVITKPMLYQAVPVGSASKKGAGREWQAMGVYDDEDLAENVVLLLLCPVLPHFLWVGDRADHFPESAASTENGATSEAAWVQWAASVGTGEVKFDNVVGQNLLLSQLQVNRSGAESDAFWTAFNEGY